MKRSLSDRWNRLRAEVAFTDLMLDATGKVLFGIGIGALLAWRLKPIAAMLMIAGLCFSAFVKAKYWARFWS